MRNSAFLGVGVLACSLAGCSSGARVVDDEPVGESSLGVITVPPRAGSNPSAATIANGRDMVLNNGTADVPYLSCGIPAGVVTTLSWFGVDLIGTGPKLPERKRGMADLPFNLSWAKGPTGEKVLTTNCLVCHGAKLGGSLIVGLGNPNLDFTQDESFFGLVPLSMDIFGMFFTPSENAEMARYRRALDTEGETTRPDTIGSNPAMADFGVFASHRDPMSLEWRAQADPNMDARNPQYSDVPAWWIVRRKQPPRMFYSGYGQGDHARIMMAASMMCVENAAEANRIDSYFGDVEAFVNSLGPPKFTDVAKRSIDTTRTGRGRDLFVNTCSGCHGDSQTNKPPLETVPASVVGTDPAYALNASTQGSGGTGTLKYFVDWWGKSWYGTVGGAGKVALESTPVYSPPPLDGVWATAPYFHNGSVPTLEAVLNPALRPAIFRRSFKPEEYDFTTKVGWPFTKVDKKDGDTTVYDATRPGYLNTGHTFAAGLTDAQRRDLLEYLKTL